MAVLTSLYSGISGLNANGAALSVIGNNIANVNTVGFKSSRASFADVLSQSLSGTSGRTQIGRGAYLSNVSPMFTQGSLESTASGLDIGIDGDGFFQVRDSAGATYYTRAGEFSISRDGFLVNSEGLFVQGYQADASGAITGTIDNIDVSSTSTPPNVTSTVRVTANLDSRVSALNTGFDVNDIADTSHFSTSLTVYDSLGNEHLVTTYFTKVYEDTAGGTGNYWQWNAVSEGAAGDAVMGLGYLQFDQSGALVAEDIADMDVDPTSPTGLNLPDPMSDFDFTGGVAQSQA
ncbi:MAG: flagellar hook-basal body complex protein, partial [Nitrospirota bacterium]|nr:flagellar hook-basal body complex protein [Nitrospirota bacterium]